MAAIASTNRTQRLVLGFFVIALAALVAILLAAPDVYGSTLKLGAGTRLWVDIAFLASISAFIVLLGIGVLRRWRWLFWLMVVAFAFGPIRVLASVLQLIDVLPGAGPAWYVVLQAAIGVVQFLIALAMIAGYRKAGTWGAF